MWCKHNNIPLSDSHFYSSIQPRTTDTVSVDRQVICPLAGDKKVTDKQIQTSLCLSIIATPGFYESKRLPHSGVDVMKRLKQSHTETHQRVKCVVGTDLEDLE